MFLSVIKILFVLQVGFAQKATIHDKINADMYGNFSRAFETLDYKLFASIHSKDMIRISGNGGEIKDVQSYLKGYQKRWNDPNRRPSPIDFRLFERIYSDNLVSDRGIYRVTYTNDKGEVQYSFGQFHIVLRSENNVWKILIDYDSNENKTINQESYDKAFSLSDSKNYVKNRNSD